MTTDVAVSTTGLRRRTVKAILAASWLALAVVLAPASAASAATSSAPTRASHEATVSSQGLPAVSGGTGNDVVAPTPKDAERIREFADSGARGGNTIGSIARSGSDPGAMFALALGAIALGVVTAGAARWRRA